MADTEDYGMDSLMDFMGDDDFDEEPHVRPNTPPRAVAGPVPTKTVPLEQQTKRKREHSPDRTSSAVSDQEILEKIAQLQAQLQQNKKPKPSPVVIAKKEQQRPPAITDQVEARRVPRLGRTSSSGIGRTAATTTTATSISKTDTTSSTTSTSKRDVETTEMFSGLKIRDRTVSSTDLRNRMQGKKFVKLTNLQAHGKAIEKGNTDPFVTIGVLAKKSQTKQSKKGESFSIWTLSDLDTAEVALFLFGKVFDTHWKEFEGCIIGLMNPTIKKNERQNGVQLSLFEPAQMMKLGQSTDYGLCKGVRKDGQPCTMAINKSLGNFCEYHVVAAFKKTRSSRMALNTNYGPETKIKQRQRAATKETGVQGLKQHMYKKGTARNVPSPQVSLASKDIQKLSNRSQYKHAVQAKQEAHTSGAFGAQRLHNQEQLLLAGRNSEKAALDKKRNEEAARSTSAAQLLDCKRGGFNKPLVGRGLASAGKVNLSMAIQPPAANAKAIQTLRQLGHAKIPKQNRNVVVIKPKQQVQYSASASQKSHQPSKLAALTGLHLDMDAAAKKKISEKRSRNASALDEEKEDLRDKRWDHQISKEKMSIKMQSIKESETMGFYCTQCNATTHRKQTTCTEKNHEVERKKAKRRWFDCTHCKYHFETLNNRNPMFPCKRCDKAPSYSRSTMRVESTKSTQDQLLVRGKERKWVSS
eukprot:m.274069 g.274069  ORF g.274069 m.274069 type:complete len:696 (+) comp110271_c0_seq1:138-2225(+)